MMGSLRPNKAAMEMVTSPGKTGEVKSFSKKNYLLKCSYFKKERFGKSEYTLNGSLNRSIFLNNVEPKIPTLSRGYVTEN